MTHTQRQPPTNRPRLVIADDDELVRLTLRAQLDHAFECLGEAANADEAISLVTLHRPDVTILDVDMPNGGAIAATLQIREASPETAITILSGDETRSEVIALMQAGATAYFRKGVNPPDLVRDLNAAINAHRRADSRVRFST